MNFLEIFSNFWAALTILVIVAIIYLAFIRFHPYSKKAKKAIATHLKGCAIDTGIWFFILFIAIGLGTQSLRAQFVFEKVIDTQILKVPLIAWSMSLVPIAFLVHSACKKYDWRTVEISVLFAIAFGYALFYWITVPFVPSMV